MERNAYLRKLVVVPEPTDAQLRVRFDRVYGQRVEVRDIAVSTPAEMAKVRQRLENKEDFAKVAAELSADKSAKKSGGLLAPFSRDDANIPQELREVAFTTLHEPKDISGDVNVGDYIHVLQLIRFIPPADKKFEDVRDSLAASFRVEAVRMQMNVRLRTLRVGADVEVLDPVVKQQIEKDQTP